MLIMRDFDMGKYKQRLVVTFGRTKCCWIQNLTTASEILLSPLSAKRTFQPCLNVACIYCAAALRLLLLRRADARGISIRDCLIEICPDKEMQSNHNTFLGASYVANNLMSSAAAPAAYDSASKNEETYAPHLVLSAQRFAAC